MFSVAVLLVVMGVIVLPAIALVAYVALSGGGAGRVPDTSRARQVSDLATRVARASGLEEAERRIQHQD